MIHLAAFTTCFLAAVSARTFFDALNNNETTYDQVVDSIYFTLDQSGQGFFTNTELQNGTAVGIQRLKIPFLSMINPANVTIDAADSNGDQKINKDELKQFFNTHVKNVDVGDLNFAVNLNSTNPISAVRSFFVKHWKRDVNSTEVATSKNVKPVLTASIVTTIVGILIVSSITAGIILTAGIIPLILTVPAALMASVSGIAILLITFAGILKLMGYQPEASDNNKIN